MRTLPLSLFLFAVVGCLATKPPNNVTIETRACQAPHDKLAFCDVTKSNLERAQALVKMLKDDEKPPLLTAREGGGDSPGPPGNVSRLGLPEYDWGVNCIHGVQTTCLESGGVTYCPTSFPNPVNLGATFNKSMYHAIGQVIGAELRALWVNGATEASEWSGRPHAGLDCWSPNININRDPRWGRNVEVPGEDPYLNGQFGALYTKGLQEAPGSSKYLQAVVTLKHWDAYSLEDSDGYTRHNFNAVVSNFTLADTFFPAFKTAVQEGKARGVMCSYNAVNGVPTCANSFLNHVLRGEWGFDGYITSDTGAVEDIYHAHKYTSSPEEAVCKALVDGGCDIDSGGVYHGHMLNAVSQKKCSMSDVDNALVRTIKLRFDLGLFDPIEDQPLWHVPLSAVNTTASQAMNLQAAEESMVLLKNDGTLPITKGKKVAVIGPHYNAQAALEGNYLGQICPDGGFSCVVSVLDAITDANAGGHTTSAEGCKVSGTDTRGIAAAVEAAKAADVVVLALGIDGSVEGESKDRKDIVLPGVQQRLADAVTATGKPVVVVLLNGGMLAIEKEKETANAIIAAGYPAFFGGVAIARTLFGDNERLGGKLAYTVYPANYTSEVKMSNMEMKPDPKTGSPGRSYRYYTGTPLWPFGYGLSYTSFAMNTTSSPASPVLRTNRADGVLTYVVKVTNTGSRTGDEVVFAFIKPKGAAARLQPGLIKQLADFERVHLNPGQSVDVTFNVARKALTLVTSDGDRVATPGEYEVIFTNGVDNVITVLVAMEGEHTMVEPFPKY